MARRAAAGARGGAEFGAGLAGVGGLEDLAAGAGAVVGRGFARRRAAGAAGQGFRAVHFVEMGFVDFGGSAGTARGLAPAPPLSERASLVSTPQAGRGGRGPAARRTTTLFHGTGGQVRGFA